MWRVFLAALAANALLLALPAFADDCDHWSAGMEEDEGGSVMVARTCMGTGNAAFELWVQCGAPGEITLRMIPVAPKNYPPPGGPDFRTRFAFDFGSEKVEKDGIYEAMNGAMAIDIRRDEPMARLLKLERSFSMTDLGGIIPASRYSLQGSAKALDKVEASCSP